MGASPVVHQFADGGYGAFTHATQVVGAHFDTDHGPAGYVDEQGGGHASKGFRKCCGGPPMQQAHGLVRARFHRHGGAESTRAVNVVGDAEVLHQRITAPFIGLCGVVLCKLHPDKGNLPIFALMEQAEGPKRILLVEDEEALRSTLKLNLELEGYAVTTAITGPDALDRLRGARFDLAVMDVMLPGLDGYSVVETVRLEGNSVPVLFLTARTAATDRIRGLRVGDDHLGKPFELEELLLRIRNLLARSAQAVAPALITRFEFNGNAIDFQAFSARTWEGNEHALSQREAMLLRLLVDRAGEVVSREEILQKVWGYNVFPTTRTVDNFIVAFRKYFERDPREPVHFRSVRGVGYRFTP
jgi:two-component system alkaline phosphatase synthesis response regulator PhoP